MPSPKMSHVKRGFGALALVAMAASLVHGQGPRGAGPYSADCDLDGSALNCSAMDIHLGAEIGYDAYRITNYQGGFISSGWNDGSWFPDHSVVQMLVFDWSDDNWLLLVNANQQHQVDTDPGGNTLAYIHYEFDFHVGPGDAVYGVRLSAAEWSGSTGNAESTATFSLGSREARIDFSGARSGTAQETVSLWYDEPVFGGASGVTVFGQLYLGSSYQFSECPGAVTCRAAFDTISVEFLTAPEFIFGDGFESGGTAAWQ